MPSAFPTWAAARGSKLLAVFYVTLTVTLKQRGEAQGLPDLAHSSPPSRSFVATGQRSSGAYATLLYAEDYVIGARVLASSLRATGTPRDLVLLYTAELSEAAQEVLASDGWQLRKVPTIANPGKWSKSAAPRTFNFPARFWGVYTKLHLFNLTEYTKVVYLDADTLVLHSLEPLFACPGLCGVLRHAEHLNTGVLSVTPSSELFAALLSAVPSLESYTGGDQGFLNSFFPDFATAPMYDPAAPANQQPGESHLWRLPTKYNADLGLYMINSHCWTIPRSSILVMHFTLGFIKPWHWWAPWVADESSTWQTARAEVFRQDAVLGITYGHSSEFVAKWMLLPLPWGLLLALIGVRVLQPQHSDCASKASKSHSRRYQDSAPGINLLPRNMTAQSVAVGLSCVVAGIIMSFLLIPHDVQPVLGWILLYEWSLFISAVLYSVYIYNASSTRYLIPCRDERLMRSVGHALLAASILGICPWVPWLCGIKAIVLQVVVTSGCTGFFGGVILIHTFIRLGALWLQVPHLATTGLRPQVLV